MATLRTPETEAKYRAQKVIDKQQGICALCERKALRDFSHWKIVENIFPYDEIAKTHHMLVIKEHISEQDISMQAWKEFREIKKDFINSTYSFILENTSLATSIPTHFHFQLIVLKD